MKKWIILLGAFMVLFGCQQEIENTGYTPDVEVSDQPVEDSSVTVNKAAVDQQGWIAIHTDTDGKNAEVIGYEQIQQGLNENMVVSIDVKKITPNLIAAVHADSGQSGAFEYPQDDVILLSNDEAVMESFSVLWLGREDAKEFATEWVKNTPTFAYDGRNLKLIEHTSIDNQHTISYEFESTHGGYGNRSGEIITQVVTPHMMVLELTGAQVTGAVIDGRYDVLTQQMITGQVDHLKYQPVQCVNTPWEEWYAAGTGRFLTNPSDYDLITAYYGEVYGVDILSFEKVEPDMAVCQACEVCPRPYYFILTVSEDNTPILTNEKWKVTAN